MTEPQQPAQNSQNTDTTTEAGTGGGKAKTKTVLATDLYLAEFRHPDVPGVVLTPTGPRNPDTGEPAELPAKQAEKFRTAAQRSGTQLHEIKE